MSKLSVGEDAPKFEGLDQDGNPVSLSDFKGRKLILYFYPKDNTPGCTAESCSLRDDWKKLRDKGFEVLGVSKDSAASHQKFISKYNLPFSLLVDEDLKAIKAYDTWGKKKFLGKKYMGIIRKTFVIDEKGKIEHIIEKIRTKDHAEQIIELYQ